MTFYISGVSAIVLAVFYLPLVFWLLRHVIRSTRWTGAKKLGALILTFAIAYAIPLGDVTWYSIAMARACPQAGLHVYKRVQAGGFFDRLGSVDVLERQPYRFIEYTRPGEKVTRLERQSDGTIARTTLDSPTAEYEVMYEDARLDRDLNVTRSRWWVRERTTGEPVGEWVMFGPRIGWVDRYLVFRWLGGSLGACMGARISYDTWVYEILPPKTSPRRLGGANEPQRIGQKDVEVR